jgi:hypothetical protein
MNIINIYGIINVSNKKYNSPIQSFETSNVKQVIKILKEMGKVNVALCINPDKNAYKDSLIKEIVRITDVKGFASSITTGYGIIVSCESVFIFDDFAQNRDFFKIRPHSQLLIKKISEEESNRIIDYIKKIKEQH